MATAGATLEQLALRHLAKNPRLVLQTKRRISEYILHDLWKQLRTVQFDTPSNLNVILPFFARLHELDLSGLSPLATRTIVDYVRGSIRTLCTLNLSQHDAIHAHTLRALRKCQYLTTLILRQCTFRGSAFRQAFSISGGFGTLQSLNLSVCVGVGDCDIRALRHLPMLRHLDLSGTGISAKALTYITKAKYASKLQQLWLSGTSVAGRYLVGSKIALLPKLDYLNISDMAFVGETHFIMLTQQCHGTLIARQLPLLNDTILPYLTKATLKRLDLGDNRTLSSEAISLAKAKLDNENAPMVLTGGRFDLKLVFASLAHAVRSYVYAIHPVVV